MKSGELTSAERYVVKMILEEAKRALVWCSDQAAYEDDSSFIMRLDKSEMATLTRALNKL